MLSLPLSFPLPLSLYSTLLTSSDEKPVISFERDRAERFSIDVRLFPPTHTDTQEVFRSGYTIDLPYNRRE